jgi:PAS domain S-box-containing protein
MQARREDPAREVKRLERCMNDLVSMVALPAIWRGSEPSQMIQTLLDALLRMLSLEFAYARLEGESGGAPMEVFRRSEHSKTSLPSEEVRSIVGEWIGSGTKCCTVQRDDQSGMEGITIFSVRLGVQGEIGLIVAGCERPGFPEKTESLLLSVAANQAFIGLQEARLLSEQKRIAAELEERVAERTQVLDRANAELRLEIAERKLAEEKLQHEEQELKRSEVHKAAILDSSADCIVAMDHQGRITEFNPSAELTFGHRREDVLGRLLAEVVIPPSLRERHYNGFARYLATGESKVLGRRLEMTALRADGREFPVELTITRIPQDGPAAFTGHIRDITERRLSEEALAKARSELAKVASMASLGVLTASIAHEVNQPLSGIITNASTCLRMLSADPANIEGARETVRRTIRDGNRASDVIARLRTLYSKKEPCPEAMDLNEAAREVTALSAPEIQRNGVSLRQEFAEDLPAAYGDRVQLQQVILNLLRNAVDAMSTIDDRPRELLVSTQRDEANQVRLSVKDSGVGFTSQVEDKIFEAFYTTKADGMGIGLSVSRSIVEAHQGRLWATANDGPGATFSFAIPCAGEGPEASADQDGQAANAA